MFAHCANKNTKEKLKEILKNLKKGKVFQVKDDP